MSPLMRVVRRLLVLIMLGAAVTAVAAPTAAQPSEDDIKEARKQFHRALELEEAGNWAGALRLFREVGEIKMTPQVRFHIALCEENLGKLVAALGGYQLALDGADSLEEGPRRQAFIDEVQGNVDQLRARIPKLIIERGKGAEAAKIELDGIELGNSTIGVETPIDPGPHQVTATAKGYEDYSKTVSVDEEQIETLVIEMKKLPKNAGTPTTGSSTTVTDDGAKKETPVVPIALMGGGGTAMLGGGVLLILGYIDLSDVRAQCPSLENCSDDLEPKDKSGRIKRTVGFISLGVGAAAAGTGLYLLLTDDKKPKKAKTGVRVVPSAPSSDAGISVFGRF